MKYVTAFGGLWRLTNRAYAELQEMIERGQDYDLDRLGRFVGVVTQVGQVEQEDD